MKVLPFILPLSFCAQSVKNDLSSFSKALDALDTERIPSFEGCLQINHSLLHMASDLSQMKGLFAFTEKRIMELRDSLHPSKITQASKLLALMADSVDALSSENYQEVVKVMHAKMRILSEVLNSARSADGNGKLTLYLDAVLTAHMASSVYGRLQQKVKKIVCEIKKLTDQVFINPEDAKQVEIMHAAKETFEQEAKGLRTTLVQKLKEKLSGLKLRYVFDDHIADFFEAFVSVSNGDDSLENVAKLERAIEQQKKQLRQPLSVELLSGLYSFLTQH